MAGKTGIDTEGGTVTYWDPNEGKYTQVPYDSSQRSHYRPGGDNFGYYENSQGDYVYGMQPQNTYQHYDGDGYTTREGVQPWTSIAPTQLGMDQGGGQPGANVVDRTPEEIEIIEDNYVTNPNRPDNTQVETDPFTGAVQRPYTPTPTLTGDNSGVQSVAPTGGAVNIDDWQARAQDQGFESSTNRDTYQMQLAGLRNQAMRNALREEHARNRPAPTQDQNADPFAWAGGSEQYDPIMGTGLSQQGENAYALNPTFGWNQDTTNQQIMADLTPGFKESTQVFLQKHPNYFNQGESWAQDRGNVQDWTTANPYTNDKGWTTAINDIAANIWQPVGGGVAGPAAPMGYAMPTGGS